MAGEIYGGSHEWGIHQNGGFISGKIPIENGWFGGTPISGNPHIWGWFETCYYTCTPIFERINIHKPSPTSPISQTVWVPGLWLMARWGSWVVTCKQVLTLIDPFISWVIFGHASENWGHAPGCNVERCGTLWNAAAGHHGAPMFRYRWLVGGPGPPLWKIWKSIGMMRFPIYGKIKNVPNHQPEMGCLSTSSTDCASQSERSRFWAQLGASPGMKHVWHQPALLFFNQPCFWLSLHFVGWVEMSCNSRFLSFKSHLVGGPGPPLWKIWKSIGMIIPNMNGKMPKMATKPPTSSYLNSPLQKLQTPPPGSIGQFFPPTCNQRPGREKLTLTFRTSSAGFWSRSLPAGLVSKRKRTLATSIHLTQVTSAHHSDLFMCL